MTTSLGMRTTTGGGSCQRASSEHVRTILRSLASTPMETLRQDIRYAVRGLRKAPAFRLVALVTLALGIGVNSSIFSVVNAILYRPLPVERPNELVDIYGHESWTNEHASRWR